jgi:hypothetical protein
VSDALLMTRAIGVAAPPDLTWRWLCQIAVAPYSYDWIDNRGRRSPQTLTPGADDLSAGQTVAVVFRLVSSDDGRAWTALTSVRGPVARLRAHALAWGDLVMMRRQLLNLKALAERDSRV